MADTLTIDLPLRVVSVLNRREHHMARHRRVRAERKAVGYALLTAKRPLTPISVHLVRLSPRSLDSHDNLCSAFKACVDEIARVYGVDDRTIYVTYSQEKQKNYGIRIIISSRSQ